MALSIDALNDNLFFDEISTNCDVFKGVLIDIPLELRQVFIGEVELFINPELIVDSLGKMIAVELLSRSNQTTNMESLFYSMSDDDLCEVTLWQLKIAEVLLSILHEIKVSINLSLRMMTHSKLLMALLTLKPDVVRGIALEVVIEDYTIKAMQEKVLISLKDIGYEIWLDDYCPNIHWALCMFNWDIVKVAREYAWSIDDDLITLMHNINSFKIIVEGIETVHLYDTYNKICFGMQGYLFGKSNVD